jgi:hypothetical protein
MEKRFTVKTMEEIICYWMEAVHLSNRLHDISECADETNVKSIADTIEDASSQVDTIRMDAEEKLKAVIDSAIVSGTSDFAKYKGAKYQDKLDQLMDMLYDQSEDIYGYSQQEQIENFYDILRSSLDELLVA